jgi:hypothetical protein
MATGNFFFFLFVYQYDFAQYPLAQLVPSLSGLVLALVNIFLPNHLINKKLLPTQSL